jgi:hypothetical protein
MQTFTDERQRRITSTVDIPGNPDTRLIISSSHDKERKQLRTTVSRATVEDRGNGYSVARTRIPDTMPDGVRSYVAMPVARYTIKALQAWHDAVVYQLDIPMLTTWATKAGDVTP